MLTTRRSSEEGNVKYIIITVFQPIHAIKIHFPHQETINVRVMERNALERENRAGRVRQMGLGEQFQIRFV